MNLFKCKIPLIIFSILCSINLCEADQPESKADSNTSVDNQKKSEKNAELYFSKAFDLDKQGKLGEAIKAYDMAIKYQPDFSIAYNNKGIMLYKQGKLEEAIKLFDIAIKYQPDFSSPYNNKGIMLYKQGKLEEAIKALYLVKILLK